jgi:hypothetical protein
MVDVPGREFGEVVEPETFPAVLETAVVVVDVT